jgi:hypothetical protein
MMTQKDNKVEAVRQIEGKSGGIEKEESGILSEQRTIMASTPDTYRF